MVPLYRYAVFVYLSALRRTTWYLCAGVSSLSTFQLLGEPRGVIVLVCRLCLPFSSEENHVVPLEPYPIYSGIIPEIIISINYVDIGTYYLPYCAYTGILFYLHVLPVIK